MFADWFWPTHRFRQCGTRHCVIKQLHIKQHIYKPAFNCPSPSPISPITLCHAKHRPVGDANIIFTNSGREVWPPPNWLVLKWAWSHYCTHLHTLLCRLAAKTARGHRNEPTGSLCGMRELWTFTNMFVLSEHEFCARVKLINSCAPMKREQWKCGIWFVCVWIYQLHLSVRRRKEWICIWPMKVKVNAVVVFCNLTKCDSRRLDYRSGALRLWEPSV